jgi:hypothetical protein
MEQYYRPDNTAGYTQDLLDELNRDLAAWLLYAYLDKGDELTDDERHEIITRHADHTAQQ